jgi:hypothetical protein
MPEAVFTGVVWTGMLCWGKAGGAALSGFFRKTTESCDDCGGGGEGCNVPEPTLGACTGWVSEERVQAINKTIARMTIEILICFTISPLPKKGGDFRFVPHSPPLTICERHEFPVQRMSTRFMPLMPSP